MATLQLKTKTHPALEKAKAKQGTLKLVPKPEPDPVPDNVVPIKQDQEQSTANKSTNPLNSKQRRNRLRFTPIHDQQTVYAYANSLGLHLDQDRLCKIGTLCAEECRNKAIKTGLRYSQEHYPDKTSWRGAVKTYPLAVLVLCFCKHPA
jgi:hypothetical protein